MTSRASRSETAPSVEEVNLADAHRLRQWLLTDGGYLDARVLPDGSVAGINDLLFTRSIALGCTWQGWSRRYCFEDRALADRRFAQLCSEDDVPAGFVANRHGLATR